MSLEKESRYQRHLENRENTSEQREGQEDAELKKAAARERVDVLWHEVKSSRQQMQNIVLHIQQVMQLVKELRQQLGLKEQTKEVASVVEDQKRFGELRQKISGYLEEVEKMKGDLIQEQMAELKNGVGVGLSTAELEGKATALVEDMLMKIRE